MTSGWPWSTASVSVSLSAKRCAWFETGDPAAVVAGIEGSLGPRWVWWDRVAADALVAGGVAVARCWDVLTVHRLLRGGWRASVPEAWAWLHDLSVDSLPTMGQLDLLAWSGDAADDAGDPGAAGARDGHLRPEWTSGGWTASPDRVVRWARLTLSAADLIGQHLASGVWFETLQHVEAGHQVEGCSAEGHVHDARLCEPSRAVILGKFQPRPGQVEAICGAVLGEHRQVDAGAAAAVEQPGRRVRGCGARHQGAPRTPEIP